MNMGAAAGAFKQAAYKDFVSSKDYDTNRALPFPAAVKAVNAAPDVHEAVFTAVQGGKGQGANQLPVLQFRGTYRAGLGIAGHAVTAGLGAAAAAGPESPSQSGESRNPHAEKEGIAKPEQDDPYNHKN